jgi:ubiquinone/menaquinone biosynthesis C-methylase UbiE
VQHIVRRLGLGRGKTVVDLGAGTGKLTRALADAGARVVAVEPLEEMRSMLERVVPEAQAVAGTAEDMPLDESSADAVTVAQAFHWFDHELALAEIHRVLRPGGWLALIWNTRDLADPFQKRLDELLAAPRGGAPRQIERGWRATVDASPLFGELEERVFPWEQPMTRSGLRERIESTSFVAQLPDDERARLLEAAVALADGLPEPFAFRYRTDVFLIPRAGEDAA